jgi:hypothetical protein
MHFVGNVVTENMSRVEHPTANPTYLGRTPGLHHRLTAQEQTTQPS